MNRDSTGISYLNRALGSSLKMKINSIELTPSYVNGTGIGRSDRALILYRRPSLMKQWKEINRFSIQTYALLWVVGPPGTGKPSAALAFAYSLDPNTLGQYFNCVRLEGDQKAVCIVKEKTLERDLAAILELTSETRRTIVFLDGYIDSSAAAKVARHECLSWYQQDKSKHRLVCVCSMVSIGKQYRPELYERIPTNVDEESLDCEMEDVGMSAGELHNQEVVYEQELFELTSWCFDDYKKAILNDDFFRNVADKFPTQSDPEKKATDRIKLLQEKFYIADGSARLMFDDSTEQASRALDIAIKAAPNIELYLKGFVDDSSTGTVNRLLAWYDGPSGYDVRLVSEYVVRHFAMVMGPHLIECFARACNVNPSMNGFILEAWFFAHLIHNGLVWSEHVGADTVEHHSWEKSPVVIFNPAKYPTAVSLDCPVWMAPTQWNRGGYDAVFIDKAAQLIRFVQVTRAESHKFDPRHFIELLDSLVVGDLEKVAMVELRFVVPVARRDTFTLSVSNEGFKKKVVQVATSPSRSTRSFPDQTLKGCRAKVMIVGVDYRITDHYWV
ncbi:hypothetical protein P3T76_010442 [Phytophthora citrophthora]|uniref:Crinkler (CRN) family protein n=1 Tax=Phytophthora citrophthora TaxID=4793 RepID=A0AAD9GCE5_9STRA|nr:hypothetical protein P3T76_010442 [Phytophthora citrophthora]